MAGAGDRTGQIVLGVAAAAVVAVAAFFALRDRAPPADPPLVASPEVVAPDTQTAEVPQPEQVAAADQSPHFDSVRIKVGDVSVIAGRAEPGGLVDILIDQTAVARAEVDQAGTFVALITIDAAAEPRTLSLMADPEGAKILSDETLLIEPTVMEVAQAATDQPIGQMADAGPEATQADQETPQAGPSEPAASTAATVDGTEVEPPSPDSATPTVLVASEEGVRVLQPASAAPEVMSAVALDSIAYDPSGEVVLAGRATGEGSVRIYLDNAPLTETPVLAAGNWSVDLPNVDTGVYTLRVDEIATDGTVLSRIETPFQREEPSAVAAAMADQTGAASFNVAVKTVQPGATLWAIARERYGSGVLYVRVFEANRDRIRDPNLIYPGQVFLMPEEGQ